MLEDEAEDGDHVRLAEEVSTKFCDTFRKTTAKFCRHAHLVVLGVDLVGVPGQVHVVAGHQEGLGVLPLEVQIHFVPTDAVYVELRVRVVGQ